MKRISLQELKQGMRFTKPVFIDSSNMLVGANVPLKEDDIKRLMKWGIAEVQTDGELMLAHEIGGKTELSAQYIKILDDFNLLLSLKDRFVEIYEKSCSEITKIHTAIRNSRNFSPNEVQKCVTSLTELLVQNRNIFLYTVGLDYNKDHLVVHAVNTSIYALIIGIGLKYDLEKMIQLGTGTMLLNAGMVQIPGYILNKENNLSERELTQIKMHPVQGYQALKSLGGLNEESATISLQHHEQYNSLGYPRKLKGIDISEFARIATVADNYEALVEDRSYRPRSYYYKAMKELVSSGSGKFDPVILRVFISVLSVYPIGSLVLLNNQKIGIVVGSFQNNPMRPVIKLLRDEKGNRIKGIEIVNLLEEQKLYIVNTLDEEEAGVNLSEAL